MSDFFKRVRSGAGKAAFEADKTRRIQALQLKIRPLNQETEKLFSQVGRVAFSLYQEDQIGQPDLKAACEELAGVFSQIGAIEQEVEAIRAETFVDASAMPQYGHICPNGHGQIPPQDNFCQTCGARAIDVPPPSDLTCLNCQAPLQAEARFCANCGQPVPPPAPAPTPHRCSNCGEPLLPDAVFCAECGEKVTPPEPILEPKRDTELEAVGEKEEVGAPTIKESESAENGIAEETLNTPTADNSEGDDKTLVKEKPVTCPDCEASLQPDAVFCTECGRQIS